MVDAFQKGKLGRRDFLRCTAAAGMALGLASRADANDARTGGGRPAAWHNWSHTASCTPAVVAEPEDEPAVIESVRRAAASGQTLKLVAAGHSFNDIACTDGYQLRLDRLNRLLAVDTDAGRVTVQAGIRLWELNEQLAAHGLALPILGDIDRQSIAGAIATGTHGSSGRHGGLATQVTGLALVTAGGEVLRCSASIEPDVFDCARVNLGALGIVTEVTLRVVPAFRLHAIEERRPIDELLQDLDEIVASSEYLKCYWFPHTSVASVFSANRTEEPRRPRSGWKRWQNESRVASGAMQALAALGRAVPGTLPAIMGLIARGYGTSEVIDESSEVFSEPRNLAFVGSEQAVPRARLVEAFRSLRELVERERLPTDLPVTLTFAAADDIPLSPAFGRDTGYIGMYLTIPRSRDELDAAVGRLEEVMDRVEARPHWGKLHAQRAESLERRYPDWGRFARVRARLDPEGRFRNPYLDRTLGPIG